MNIPEYKLDLTAQLSQELYMKFDVAFNHTTLEHIFENRIAFSNICKMAKDAVIVVVPCVQQVHIIEESFEDYWRYSPYTMQRLFEENGYSMVVCSYNNDFDTAVYLFCIGIRKEKLLDDKYKRFSQVIVNNVSPAGGWIGTGTVRGTIKRLLKKHKVMHK